MESAFLVRIRGRAAGTVAHRSWLPTTEAIGFEPSSVRRWHTGPDARFPVEVTAFDPSPTGGDAEPSSSFQDDRGGLTAVVGHVRQRGRSWSAPDRWARELANLGPTASRGRLHEDLLGIFAALHVTAEGDGWIATDPLTFRYLYVAEHGDELIVASRPQLAAGPGGGSIDTRSTGWMVALSHHLGRSTSLRGVRVLDPGAILRLDRGEPSWDLATSPLAAPPTTAPIPDVAAAVVEEGAEALRAALSLPTGRRVFELTGGKDSRFLLAVAIHANLQHDLEFETVGPPQLPDVKVAASLAEQLGLRHQARFVGLRPPLPYGEMAGRFVDRTIGLVNAWDATHPAPADELRIGGIFGEVIRSFYPVPVPSRTDGDLSRMFDHRRFDRLGLLRPALASDLRDELLERLRTEPRPDADVYTRLHAHYVHDRLPSVRFGPREEVAGTTVRHHPLYSLHNLRSGQLASGADRESELVFAEVMRSACDLLVRHPFAAGRGWDDRALEFLDGRPAGPPTPDAPDRPAVEPRLAAEPAPARATAAAVGRSDAAPALVEEHSSLMKHLVEVARDERVAFVAESLDRAGPAADEVFDVARARALLETWTDLDIAERRQIFAAGTVARRLADGAAHDRGTSANH